MRRPAVSSRYFLVVLFVQPIADQREAHNAAIPKSHIADSPYFHPHSLWSFFSGASWVYSIWNGCCRLGRELTLFKRSRSSPTPQSPELGDFGFSSFTLLIFSADPVGFDFAAVRILHRLPTACGVEYSAFAQQPQPPSFSRACRLVLPGAVPIVLDPYRVHDG